MKMISEFSLEGQRIRIYPLRRKIKERKRKIEALANWEGVANRRFQAKGPDEQRLWDDKQ